MADAQMSENSYAMLTHLSPLAGYVIPFGNIIGPLVMWLIKRDQSPFLERVGREALNFQITVMLAVGCASSASSSPSGSASSCLDRSLRSS